MNRFIFLSYGLEMDGHSIVIVRRDMNEYRNLISVNEAIIVFMTD